MFKRREPLSYENALSRAAGLCARCEQCTPDIMKKLSTWGVNQSDSTKVMKRLKELNFIDDERFAKAYAHDKLHFNSWGRKRIQQGLWSKRLDPSLIECACDDFEDEEYRSVALRVIKYKTKALREWPLSRENKLKVIKFAMQRGFEYPIIADIMRTTDYRSDSNE